MKIKILTWNINKASYTTRENLWDYLRKLDFDVGLFQEVYMSPYEIRKNYHVVRGEMNAILLKREKFFDVKEENILPNNLNPAIYDFFVSCKAGLFGNKLTFISVYNYIFTETTKFSEFLKNLYEYIKYSRNKIFIGGDFNMNENYQGYLEKLGELAKEMKKDLSDMGYVEAAYKRYGENVYTYIVPGNKEKKYQLDYLFIPKDIGSVDVEVGDENKIFNTKQRSSDSKQPRLSDHLPIIATVDIQ